MKKVYLFSLSLFASAVLTAQEAPKFENLPLLPTLNGDMYNQDKPDVVQERAGGDVFYTNTFDDELDWTIINDGAQGDWEYGGPTDPSLAPNYMSDIASTTKADGYYFFNGVQYLVAGNVTTQDVSIQNTVAINCATRPGVLIEFEQSYRAFNDDVVMLQVSNNGTTWTDYELNSNVPGNTGTDDNILINISDVAGSQATVFLRFRWQGNAGGYGWIIDDLTLTEAHADDIIQQDVYTADIFTGYEYSRIPQSQGQILTVQSALYNAGVNAPVNMQSHVVVTDAAMTVVIDETGGTLSGPLNSGEEDTLTFTTSLDLSTLAVGVYTVTNTIEQTSVDGDPTSDVLVTKFEITDNIYSHFDLDETALFFENPGRNNSSTYDGFSFGSEFEIATTDFIQGVDFMIDTRTLDATNFIYPTTTDNEIRVQIWEATTDFGAPTFQAEYSFEMSDLTIGGWNTLNFNRPAESSADVGAFEMQAGSIYRVVVACDGGYVLWGIVTLDDSDFSGVQYSETQSSWFSLQAELALDLNFDVTLSIEDENTLDNISVSQNVPNPFNGSTVVSYNLNEASNVSIEIIDVTGKVVSTINEGTQTAGEHNITIDGSTLAEGTYFYTFTAGEYQVTKRMVVSK